MSDHISANELVKLNEMMDSVLDYLEGNDYVISDRLFLLLTSVLKESGKRFDLLQSGLE